MLIDARTLEHNAVVKADVCIIGGGLAGLVLCRKLVAAGKDVVVLESGTRGANARQSALISGENHGSAPLALGGMRRQLAGGVNDWGANCALADKRDFRPAQAGQRDWPIRWDDLADFGDDALTLLGIQTQQDRATLRAPASHIDTPDGKGIATKSYIKADQALGDNLCRDVARPNFAGRILTYATALKFDLSEGARTVQSVQVAAGTSPVTIRAKTYILCSGLENAATLMRGLAADPDQVRKRWPAMGRGLHSHLLTLFGAVQATRPWDGFNRCTMPVILARGTTTEERFSGLSLTADDDPTHLNSVVFFVPPVRSLLTSKSALRTARRQLGWRRFERPHMLLRHFLEQPVRWESRVELGPVAGPLGLRTPHYHWHVGRPEHATILQNCRRLRQLFYVNALGVVSGTDGPVVGAHKSIHQNAHPAGGTLMGLDPNTSVVDQDLKVHGLSNLYVCGSSVIPRSGTTMVTGIIAQLALRLATHLVYKSTP